MMTSQQSPEGGFATRGDTFLACIARNDIRCDVDETMWTDREERLDVHA